MALARNHMFFAASTLIMGLAALYIAWSMVWSLPWPLWSRIALTLVLLAAAQAMSFMRYMVLRAPGLPFWFMRVGGFICSVFMTLSTLVILRDICLLFIAPFSIALERMEPSAQHWLASPQCSLVLTILSFTLAGLGMRNALKVPGVKKTCLEIEGLPAAWSGLTIVLLADLHIGSTFDGKWLAKVVENCNVLNPDLVLIAGDLVDGTPKELGTSMAPLTNLKAKLSVLLCVGNHEYYSGVMPWVQAWRNMGLTVLLNEHRVFTNEGQNIIVAGVADPVAKRFPGLPKPDAKAALAGAPQGFSILMAHQPRPAQTYAALGFDMQLAGHTHGGQYVPLFPISTLLHKYRKGLYHVEKMLLYVSPGTGLWGYVPMRVGCPSEITLLELRKKFI